jgi:hypothetical protein
MKELTYKEAIAQVSWTGKCLCTLEITSRNSKDSSRYLTAIKVEDTKDGWALTDRYDPAVHARALKLMEDSRNGQYYDGH